MKKRLPRPNKRWPLTVLKRVFSTARRKPKRTAFLGLVFLFGVMMLRGGPPLEIPEATVADVESITVTMPERTKAGQPFIIEVSGLEVGVEVEATIDTGYGVSRITTIVEEPSMEIEVPAFDRPASGLTMVTVLQGSAATIETIEIEPGPPTDPINVYLGPRTVIADAEHFVMLVAVPTDDGGNPVAAGTPVDYTVTRPDLSVETATAPTKNLLSWFEVFSRTVTGRTRLAAVAGDAGAAERTFLEVAGVPDSYKLELIDPLLPADGLALLRIRTEVLADEFGNVLPDGTVVYLDAEGVSGRRRIHGQTNGGTAEFTLEVPEEPGSVRLEAIASGAISDPFWLNFGTAVQTLTAEIEVTDDAVMVHVGPVRSVRDSYVPEGVVAKVTLADGTTGTADLSLGVGTAFFPADADATEATVEVLGSEIVVAGPALTSPTN